MFADNLYLQDINSGKYLKLQITCVETETEQTKSVPELKQMYDKTCFCSTTHKSQNLI